MRCHPQVDQNLNHAEIYSDNITSFSFWRCTGNDPVRVTVTYWDDTTTFQDFTGSYSWQQHFVTGLTAGKRLKKVKFEGTEEGVNHGGIDDLSYYPSPLSYTLDTLYSTYLFSTLQFTKASESSAQRQSWFREKN